MIRIVPETGSTNADLLAALRQGEPLLEGDWLVADRQSAGRGRQGRGWFDGFGNFMGSTIVRIQDDRGHTVATAGPYHYLRHPTYLATIVGWLGTPPILESWWALIPAALAGAMMILRTALEDRMLHEELPGYADYARQVRYRLLPGIW